MRRLSGNRQNCSLYIRLFSDELESIKQAAALEKKSVSEYVRARVLDNRPQVIAAHVPDPPAETVTAPIEKQSPAKVAKQAKPPAMMFAKDKWKKK
jgi:hypothetical protein